MKLRTTIVLIVVFALGVAAGAVAAKKGIDRALYSGKSKDEAATALLDVAKRQAGKGSWENIALGRVYYLSGKKAEADTFFNAVAKKEGSDWLRIGRIYNEADDWEKAKEAFDRALKLEPKDAPWLAEIGGYYNLHGEREKAEEMFAKSFGIESDEFWSTVNMAGSYCGVKPQ